MLLKYAVNQNNVSLKYRSRIYRSFTRDEKGYIEILCVTDSMLNNFKKMIRPQEK